MKMEFSKNLPPELTSYDFLKSFAVITMIIDHVGMYLFPEQNEWRIIGRMSMPVWLFLVGYANSRELSNLLWIGGSILVLSTIVFGESIFSVNILFTILIVRVFLNPTMEFFFKNTETMFLATFAMILLVLPTGYLWDYGTHAFLFAMYGYLVRHQRELALSNIFILAFMGGIVVVHSFYQQYSFGFVHMDAVYSAAGILGISVFMTDFRSRLYPNLTKLLPMPLTGFIKLMGRHSLEIYVVHLLVLKSIAFYLYPESFGWFQWHWFYG